MRWPGGGVRNLLQGLWFVPALIVVVYAVVAVVLVEVDNRARLAGGRCLQAILRLLVRFFR